MATHKLVFLRDLDVEDACFIQLLGFAKQNPSEKETKIDGEHCTIHVHETADPDEATDRLIHGAEGIVCFYDVASRQSYKQIEEIHDKIQKNSPPPFQMVLVGIIRDETRHEVSVDDGDELARKLGCKFSLEIKDTVGVVLDRIIRLYRQARKAQGIPWWNWRSWGCCLCWGR